MAESDEQLDRLVQRARALATTHDEPPMEVSGGLVLGSAAGFAGGGTDMVDEFARAMRGHRFPSSAVHELVRLADGKRSVLFAAIHRLDQERPADALAAQLLVESILQLRKAET